MKRERAREGVKESPGGFLCRARDLERLIRRLEGELAAGKKSALLRMGLEASDVVGDALVTFLGKEAPRSEVRGADLHRYLRAFVEREFLHRWRQSGTWRNRVGGDASLLEELDRREGEASRARMGDPAGRLAQQEERERLLDALGALEPAQRALIGILFWEGSSERAAARRLGVSRRRARRLLRDSLGVLRGRVGD